MSTSTKTKLVCRNRLHLALRPAVAHHLTASKMTAACPVLKLQNQKHLLSEAVCPIQPPLEVLQGWQTPSTLDQVGCQQQAAPPDALALQVPYKLQDIVVPALKDGLGLQTLHKGLQAERAEGVVVEVHVRDEVLH